MVLMFPMSITNLFFTESSDGEEAFVTGHRRMTMWLYQDPQRPSVPQQLGRTGGRVQRHSEHIRF